jgi:hypothetical protein
MISCWQILFSSCSLLLAPKNESFVFPFSITKFLHINHYLVAASHSMSDSLTSVLACMMPRFSLSALDLLPA